MAKRSKSTSRPVKLIAPPAAVVHPPVKSPALLAVSIVLFASWFVFLLVMALWR
jgi:hypothetical protein